MPSTRSSSKSRRAKRPRWIPSSGCCWKWRMRRWSTPGFRPIRCAIRRPGFSPGRASASTDIWRRRDLSQVDAWSGTGGALSIIANRVSYFLDLRGPSVAVDTACSSSLVAVHLACQSLRTGDANLALAAGVNLMLSPAVTRSFDQAEAMSPTGRCHAFDAAADGFVRGEGCGVVVLKRLGDALRDGDRVLAVVRGSAVNQDGRSNGLMAPNPAAQMAVLRAAYASAGVEPREVDYVEAHGTGTLLGDPIEARALGTVLGRGRGADVAAADRLGQDESGSFGGGGRDRRVSSRRCWRCSAGAFPRTWTSTTRIRTSRLRSSRLKVVARTHRLAVDGAAAAGRGVVVRVRRHQCACGARAGPGYRIRCSG